VAKAAGAQVGVLAGQVRLPAGEYHRAGVEAAASCMEDGVDLEYAVTHGAMLLDRAARRFVRDNIGKEVLQNGNQAYLRKEGSSS
jgi:hypothetical protein